MIDKAGRDIGNQRKCSTRVEGRELLRLRGRINNRRDNDWETETRNAKGCADAIATSVPETWELATMHQIYGGTGNDQEHWED